MGVAIRTGSPLSLNLAEPVWKQLAGIPLSMTDITEVDRDYLAGLLYIRDFEGDEKTIEHLEMPFSTTSASGQEIYLSSSHKTITLENREEYFRLALDFR